MDSDEEEIIVKKNHKDVVYDVDSDVIYLFLIQ